MVIAESVLADQQVHSLFGVELPLWSVLPFVGLLLSIAALPLLGTLVGTQPEQGPRRAGIRGADRSLPRRPLFVVTLVFFR